MFDQLLTNYLVQDFWPAYFFVNDYPVLAVFWNFFLGSVPLLVLAAMKKSLPRDGKLTIVNRASIKALFLVWLLFLPNSAYIITEIRHLSGMYNSINVFNREMYEVWIILFFFVYSFFGYLLYYFSVSRMLAFLQSRFFADRRFMLPMISFFGAWGVLFGLVDRWNSWEVFLSPAVILHDLARYFTEWDYFKNLIIYFLFFYLMHLYVDRLFENRQGNRA